MSRAFLALYARDVRLALRQGADAAMALAFFLIAAALFPLGLGPSLDTLGRIAPGVVWVLALLSVILSLDRLFQADHEDGTLELIALNPHPLFLLVLAKVAAHWTTTGLPLILLSPAIALMLNLGEAGYLPLIIGLLLGTPALSLIGAIGAALSLGARRAGVLTALLVLPLTVPVLIFGVGAVEAAILGLPVAPHLALQGAVLAGALVLAPWAAGAAIRQAVQ